MNYQTLAFPVTDPARFPTTGFDSSLGRRRSIENTEHRVFAVPDLAIRYKQFPIRFSGHFLPEIKRRSPVFIDRDGRSGKRKVEPLEAEMKAPGRECAYVFDARERIGTK
ncbi:MAG: hypothetical protein ACLQU1_30355 [Bryobacteraceae bacterium]